MTSLTAVQYLQTRAHSCGYCRSGRDSDGEEEEEEGGSSKSFGMLVPALTAEQYERLLERGWRRSGTYIYRPYNESTCCPQHPIRLKASEFQADKVLIKWKPSLLPADAKPSLSDQNPCRSKDALGASFNRHCLALLDQWVQQPHSCSLMAQ